MTMEEHGQWPLVLLPETTLKKARYGYLYIVDAYPW